MDPNKLSKDENKMLDNRQKKINKQKEGSPLKKMLNIILIQ